MFETDVRRFAIRHQRSVLVVTLGNGPRRFSELERSIGSISQRMLTLTLHALERRPDLAPPAGNSRVPSSL